MGVLQGLERRLQGAVGNTFARLFGGSVQPGEVASALQSEAARNAERRGDHTIAPNHYIVQLGRSDHANVSGDVDRVQDAFGTMVGDYLDSRGWETFGDVAVTLVESDVLHTGQFRIRALIDPDADRHHQAADAHAPQAHVRQRGEAPMTQSHGDPRHQPDGAPYQPPGYGQPDYGQPQYGQAPYAEHQYQAQQYQGQEQAQQYQGQQYADPYPASAPQYGQQPYPGAPSYPQAQPYQPYGQPAAYPQGDPYQQWPQAPQPPTQQAPQQPMQPQQAPAPAQQPPYAPADPSHPNALGLFPTPVLSIDDGTGRSYEVQQGSNILGRGQDSDFRIPDTSVSRRHADLYFDGRTVVLHDLGSTNGTTVNGSTVQTWQLADGDVIRLGHSTVVFTLR